MTTSYALEWKNDDKLKKNGSVWSETDDKYLLKLILLNCKYDDISHYLERSEDAIKARFVKTMVCPKYTKKSLNDNIDNLCKAFDITKDDMVRYITYAIPSFKITNIQKNRIDYI